LKNPRRPALGRGLSALIPDARATTGAPGALPTTGESSALRELRLDQITAAARQPRARFDDVKLRELAASLASDGLLQPIVVRQVGELFEIIAGERRYRAAHLAGLERVPVLVREASDADAYQLALIENVQRADLDPIEEAEAYRFLVSECALTHEQVAKRVGRERATVSNALRLLKLPEPLRDALIAGDLRGGHARAILTAPADLQLALGQQAIAEGWNVRETERQARAAREPGETTSVPADPTPEPPTPEVPASPADQAVETQLRGALGAPVRLHHKGGKGRIEIRFHSLDELERLIDLISGLEGR
jgi:ParB family transcriptional regulator, chromosome partitioning protein